MIFVVILQVNNFRSESFRLRGFFCFRMFYIQPKALLLQLCIKILAYPSDTGILLRFLIGEVVIKFDFYGR